MLNINIKMYSYTINLSKLLLENIVHSTFHLNTFSYKVALVNKCNAWPVIELQRFIAVSKIAVPSTKISFFINLCIEDKK